jgi:hypothetical protein
MHSKRIRISISVQRIAAICSLVLITCFAATQLPGQEKKRYQAGTIVDVKPHGSAQSNSDEKSQFDISVKVGAMIYVVLYTPPAGQNYPELGIGMDRTVLVDGDTMKVNDLLGRTRSMPILSTKDAPPKSAN